MKKTLLVLILTALFGGINADAQLGRQMALSHSPAYESAAASLRGAPARQYNFSKAVLSDVMRLMAEDAGIGFFGLPDGAGGSDRLVTFTIKASPFVALETLAKANGITLIYEAGIWYLRPANDQELIGRIYEIHYNAQELVTKSSQGSVGGGTQGGGAQGGAQGGGAGGGAGGLSLQGSPDFFVTEPSRILEDIQNLLNIPVTGGNATFAPTTSVDAGGGFSLGALQGQPNLVVNQPSSPGGDADSGTGSAKVIWNSDSNTLYVVASRQQHQWIEAYLASADRPQPMISVEVKFLETSRDPSTDIGIDWDGALGSTGLEANLSNLSSPLNLNNVGNYSLPTAVLSYSDLNLKLRAIYNDRRTRSVSYPRMVTLDNREVSFRSVVNQPVLGSSASTSLGAGATQTSAVEYLPIGTVINVLPKRMSGERILLNVSVTVSDIIGTEFINGNPFPIATSRVYTAPLTVKSGYTVAISGLDAARTSDDERGLPVLGKLPVLGNAFKRRQRDRSRQHLMMLITPVAMHCPTQGLTEKPISKEPWKVAQGKEPICDTGLPARTNSDLRATPVHHTPVREVAPEIPAFDEQPMSKKASQTFGQTSAMMESPKPAMKKTSSMGSDSTALNAASAVAIAKPVPAPDNTPMIVETAPEPAAATMPEAAPKPVAKAPATPKKVPAEAKPAAAPKVDAGQVTQIKASVDSLKAQINKIPSGDGKLSPDDAQIVSNAYDQSQKLLSQVDQVRGDKSRPLQGELGDVWWDLINLKTKVVKLGRRSPESLALNKGEEE